MHILGRILEPLTIARNHFLANLHTNGTLRKHFFHYAALIFVGTVSNNGNQNVRQHLWDLFICCTVVG